MNDDVANRRWLRLVSRHDDFLRLLASRSDHKQHKLAALVFDKRGKLISYGYNKLHTHPKQLELSLNTYKNRYHSFLHAEISALVKCRKEPHFIVVARVRKNGKFALSKPCEMCMSAIIESGVKKLCYHNGSDFVVEEIQ